MTPASSLEQRLQTLIDTFHQLRLEKEELGQSLGERETRILELEHQVEQLRARIDEMDKDRFTVKRLKDERKVIRRRVQGALTRLNELEEEL